MAINYLNNVDFNRNELQNAQLIKSQVENQPNDAAVGGTPVEGQLYFNTANDVLKVYANGSWVAVGGGVESIDLLNSTYVSLADTGTTAIPELTASLSASDGSSGASERYLTKSNVWAEISTIPGTYTFDVDGDFGTTQTIVSGDTLTIGGDGVKISTTVSSTDILTISHELQSQTNSTSTASPAAGATFTVIDSVTVDTTGHIGGKNLKTITLPADTNTQETYTLPVSAGTAVSGHSVADIDLTAAGTSTGIKSRVTIAGNNDNIAITETTGNNGIVKIALTQDVVIGDTLTVGGDIAQTSGGNENVFASELNMSSQKITNVLDPTSAQDAATKQYVDDATVGGLIYQGGYNSSTNVPVLDSRGTQIAVEKGWTYTVTDDGTFYGEVVRAGDVLIAEVDLASGAGALTDWTTVQNNVDLASLATIGIGNVNKSTVATLDGISVGYSSGTASVGLDIQGLTYITNNLETADLQGIEIPIYNGEAATAANEKIEIADLVTLINNKYNDKDTIPIGDLAGTVTHNWNTKNTIVQTIDQNGDTVFCDITRTTSTVTATISEAQTAATGGIITILVQRIG